MSKTSDQQAKPELVCTLPESTLGDLEIEEKENLKVPEEQKVVKDTKEMQNKVDEQTEPLAEAKTEKNDTATPDSSSKLCVNKVVQLMVSNATEKAELNQVKNALEETAKLAKKECEEAKKAVNEAQAALSEEKTMVEDAKRQTEQEKQVLEEVQFVFKDETNRASASALEKTLKLQKKVRVNWVIQLVVLLAKEKVSSKYKIFTERLTPNCISHRLIEKIWPEVEEKHLNLSHDSIFNVGKAILKDLCNTHNCKENLLIFNLREQLDNITVSIFTKHLLALPPRVLSVSKDRQEYKEVVKNVTKDLVMHAMSEGNETMTLNPVASEFIVERLFQKIWDKILSKKYKMSLENIGELALTIYNELHDRWDSPMLLMWSRNPVMDEAIVSSFKKHAKLRSQNIIFRAFSCAR